MQTTKSCVNLTKILKNVNKPSRYTGGEIGSIIKNPSEITINFALIFPDLYELGISNLGCKILYNVLNKEPYIWAQRAYAPDIDMKEQLEQNNIPLFAHESKQPLKTFDIMAFSLQYELSFPTVLGILKLSHVPIKNIDRKETDPIIQAGGPAAYNPLPMQEFIDIFNFGDGEEVLVEISKTLKTLKEKGATRDEKLFELSKIEGAYVPKFHKNFIKENGKIKKRICDLSKINELENFPISYAPCTHDRVVTEIRRGCGRMCRFCQSCFTNLPIRERKPEDIISSTGRLLENTGYEEYSLLSLSSNDYSNINETVKELSARHSADGISISLPSQRADSFNLELANMVQKVRKSTMTFAPEAGSQRLRDVINKNLTKEQILNAILTCYKSGWSRVKLYFMIGLPTETFEDLEELINLLKTIKLEALKLKKENGFNHHLDLTCTLSIFVPKPHTPFAWFGQNNPSLLQEKISYLINLVKKLKGVKLNFSNIFISQLEAIITRGDEQIGELIYKVFEKGAYLDSENHYMKKERWIDAATELNLNLDELSTQEFDINQTLPWDFIDTGVEKQWLQNEYNQALNNQNSIPCDKKCSNCGVCKNTNMKKKIFKENSFISCTKTPPEIDKNAQNSHFYRILLSKKDDLKYISHLDWLGTFYKVLKRSKIELVFSQGFNPSPKISASVALPIFVESDGEFLDIEIYNNFTENELKSKIEANLPEGATIINIKKITKNTPKIDQLVFWGKYSAQLEDYTLAKIDDLMYKINKLMNEEEFFISKANKKGLSQQINIRPSIHSIDIDKSGKLNFVIKTGQLGAEKIKQLRADDFLMAIFPQYNWSIKRTGLLNEKLEDITKVL